MHVFHPCSRLWTCSVCNFSTSWNCLRMSSTLINVFLWLCSANYPQQKCNCITHQPCFFRINLNIFICRRTMIFMKELELVRSVLHFVDLSNWSEFTFPHSSEPYQMTYQVHHIAHFVKKKVKYKLHSKNLISLPLNLAFFF